MFFRAISRSYKDITGIFLHHLDLRKQCVDRIISDAALRARFFDEIDFLSYTQNMSRDGTFADELCIISLSKVLNKKICVFTPQHGLQEFGQLRDGDFFPKRVAH